MNDLYRALGAINSMRRQVAKTTEPRGCAPAKLAATAPLPMVGGLLVTAVLLGSAPQNSWMLPGMWQIIYSLGIFSSCRFLPRAMLVAGGWYLITGLACMAIADSRALSPFAMGVPFGVGQL